MTTTNALLMREARESLTGKWFLAIMTCLVYMLITNIQLPMRIFPYSFFQVSFGFAGLILGGPLTLGLATFSLSLSRNQEARFEQLFDGFNRFYDAFIAYI